MNEKLTELVFIVDRSGSMAGMESDTIGGVNAVLEKNREAEGETLVSVVLFDHETKVLRDRVPIQKVPKLTRDDYQVRGCTALLDAVGGSVQFIEKIQRYLPEEIRPAKTIFVITTDGYENASRKFSYETVKRVIEERTKDGWEFLFLGANIDAAAEADRIGIAPDRAESYYNDGAGAKAMYESVADATFAMNSAPVGAPRMGGGWKASILRDRRRRGK
jgi:uncharacterized protein YegL